MGRMFWILTISAVLAAASPLPDLPGSPSPQAHSGEALPLPADKGKSFTDELVNSIKASYAKEIDFADGDSPIADDVPKGMPVEHNRDHNGVGVSVGGVGVDVGGGGVEVNVGKGGHHGGVGVDVGGKGGRSGVGVDVGGKGGRPGVGVDVGKAKVKVRAASLPYMNTGSVDTTHREDQPSNKNGIQAGDDDYRDDDRRGGLRDRGNGGFRIAAD